MASSSSVVEGGVVGRAVPSPCQYPARDLVEQHVDDLSFSDGDGAAGASFVPDSGVLATRGGGGPSSEPRPTTPPRALAHPPAVAAPSPPSSSSPSPYRYPASDPVEQHVDDLPERDVFLAIIIISSLT
jgi:hypothetical protein